MALPGGHLFAWIKTVRTDGLEALLQRGKPGPKGGSCRGVPDEVITELKTRLQAGEFITGMDAVRWLKEAHGIERPYNTVWQWLKKAGGVLLAPRPSHSKKDPAAAQAFKEGLAEQLEKLDLPEGSRIKPSYTTCPGTGIVRTRPHSFKL